jgi:hypothetical protein
MELFVRFARPQLMDAANVLPLLSVSNASLSSTSILRHALPVPPHLLVALSAVLPPPASPAMVAST